MKAQAVEGQGTAPKRYALRAVAAATAMAALGGAMARGSWTCPTAGLFHVPCPTCGVTRSVRALVHLDVGGVFRFNPFALLLAPILAGLAWRTLALVWTEGHAKRLDEERLGRFFLLALFWTVVASFGFWALRFLGWFGGPCPV